MIVNELFQALLSPTGKGEAKATSERRTNIDSTTNNASFAGNISINRGIS